MLPCDCLKRDEDVIAQPNGVGLVLFHMTSGNYYSLNEMGTRIWELCDGSRSLDEIVDLLESEYEAPREVVLKDCSALAAELLANGLLIPRSDDHAVSG